MDRCILFFILLFLLPNHNAFSQNSTPHKIRLGVSTALSGDAATYGLDVRDIVTFAADKLGGGEYELIFEDDKCGSKSAASVAQKFVGVDKVDAVIGYACSGAMLAAAPILERGKILTMVTCASADAIAQAGQYVFRSFPSDRGVAAKLAEHIAKKHQSIGILSDQTEYTQGMKENFVEAAKGYSLKIESEDFIPGTSDYRTYILKMKQHQVDALFVNPQTEAGAASILKQIREINWNVPIYTVYWPSSPAFLNIAGPQANGIEFSDAPGIQDLLTLEHIKLYEEYVSKFGKIRSLESVFASTYEGFRALHEALHSTKDPKEFLLNSHFEGIFGQYSFDTNGEIKGFGFVLKRIENGEPVTFHS